MIVHAGLSLKVVSIANRGDINHERVHLQVVKPCNAAQYIILATVLSGPNTVYAGTRPAYWFDNKRLNVGDNLILYTKAGMPSFQGNPDGTFTYFFYWGMTKAMFGAVEARAMIAELSYWETGG
jgi:hypothetical protein